MDFRSNYLVINLYQIDLVLSVTYATQFKIIYTGGNLKVTLFLVVTGNLGAVSFKMFVPFYTACF
jgi:hypothetical protein